MNMTQSTTIHVDDRMQSDYSYQLVAEPGQDFADGFNPCHSPQEMLEMGVFEGKYLNDCTQEFPEEWFENAKISSSAGEVLPAMQGKSAQIARPATFSAGANSDRRCCNGRMIH